MTDEHAKAAIAAIEQQFLAADDSTEAANRFLDLAETLRERPDEFWEQYFSDPKDEELGKVKAALKKYGTNITFEQLKQALDPLAEQQ